MDATLYDSPIGLILISANDEGLIALEFQDGRKNKGDSQSGEPPVNPHLRAAVEDLDRYFEGEFTPFESRFALGGTQFQRMVWTELGKLATGSTAHYEEIATRIGNPKACRAVGLANNRNPLPIFIPCHRVVGKDGSLTGYAGELWRKKWLLAHEGALS